MANDSASAQASTPEHLSWPERVVAGLIGAGILIWSAVLLFSPPEHKEVISGCKATTTKDCVQTVSSIPETVTTALVGVGAVLVLIALLGIRFSSIKAPGGFELGTSTTETTKDEAEGAANQGKANPVVPPPTAEMFRASTVNEETTAARLRAWSLLPPNVREAAVRRWASSGKTGDPSTQVAQIYAPAANNNDWFIVFVDDTTFRITVAAT